MNKGLRNELKQKNYRRRLRKYQIADDTEGNFHAFKTTGKPCSKKCCSPYKYDRKKPKFRKGGHE